MERPRRNRRGNRRSGLTLVSVGIAFGAWLAAENPSRAETGSSTKVRFFANASAIAEHAASYPLVETSPLFVLGEFGFDDEKLPVARRQELRREIELEFERSFGARLESGRLSLGDAKTLARVRRKPLFYVAPRFGRSGWKFEFSEFGFARRFWERALEPEGHLLAREVATSALSPRLSSKGEKKDWSPAAKITTPLADVVAASCHTTESETRLTFVGRRRIVSGTVESGRFVSRAERNWDELSPLSPTPLRVPLAKAVQGERGLLVGSSDRDRLVELDSTLALVDSGPRSYPIAETTCHPFQDDGIDVAPVPCFGADAKVTGGPASEETRFAFVAQSYGFSDATRPIVLRVAQSSRSAISMVSSPELAPTRTLSPGTLLGAASLGSKTPWFFFLDEASGTLYRRTFEQRSWARDLETPSPKHLRVVVECPFEESLGSSAWFVGTEESWLVRE